MFALAHGLLERIIRKGPLICRTWIVHLPATQAADLLVCIEAVRRVLASQATQELAAAADRRLGPSAGIARALVEQGERLPDWLGLLGLLEECLWVWDAPQAMPRRSYDAIYGRDGYRCMAPGCMSRARLHVHHLVYRSLLGGSDASNLLVLCSYHHLQGEHGGLARARGRAPLDVHWRLGSDEFATFYRNERRLDADPFRTSASQ